MRISRPQMFMEIAHVVSRRSTCFRLNVGAVVTAHGRIVSIGYNGQPPGARHCQGNDCPGREGCHETIHAEINALGHVPVGVTGRLQVYVTDSPCIDCARVIVNSGQGRIDRVFYDRPYRLGQHGIDYLMENDIAVYRITPAGYVIDQASGRILDSSEFD
jgi:dCMP deaminase